VPFLYTRLATQARGREAPNGNQNQPTHEPYQELLLASSMPRTPKTEAYEMKKDVPTATAICLVMCLGAVVAAALAQVPDVVLVALASPIPVLALRLTPRKLRRLKPRQ
jgi:hypothetical protein